MRKYIKGVGRQHTSTNKLIKQANTRLFKQAKRRFHYQPNEDLHYIHSGKSIAAKSKHSFKDDESTVKDIRAEGNQINQSSWLSKLVNGIEEHIDQDRIKIDQEHIKNKQHTNANIHHAHSNNQLKDIHIEYDSIKLQSNDNANGMYAAPPHTCSNSVYPSKKSSFNKKAQNEGKENKPMERSSKDSTRIATRRNTKTSLDRAISTPNVKTINELIRINKKLAQDSREMDNDRQDKSKEKSKEGFKSKCPSRSISKSDEKGRRNQSLSPLHKSSKNSKNVKRYSLINDQKQHQTISDIQQIECFTQKQPNKHEDHIKIEDIFKDTISDDLFNEVKNISSITKTTNPSGKRVGSIRKNTSYSQNSTINKLDLMHSGITSHINEKANDLQDTDLKIVKINDLPTSTVTYNYDYTRNEPSSQRRIANANESERVRRQQRMRRQEREDGVKKESSGSIADDAVRAIKQKYSNNSKRFKYNVEQARAEEVPTIDAALQSILKEKHEINAKIASRVMTFRQRQQPVNIYHQANSKPACSAQQSEAQRLFNKLSNHNKLITAATLPTDNLSEQEKYAAGNIINKVKYKGETYSLEKFIAEFQSKYIFNKAKPISPEISSKPISPDINREAYIEKPSQFFNQTFNNNQIPFSNNQIPFNNQISITKNADTDRYRYLPEPTRISQAKPQGEENDCSIQKLNNKLNSYITFHNLYQLNGIDIRQFQQNAEPTYRAIHLNFNQLKKHCEIVRSKAIR